MELGTTKELNLVFGTDAGTELSVNLTDCVEEPDAEAVATAMDTIVSKQVLMDAAGNLAASSKAAYLVETTRTAVFE